MMPKSADPERLALANYALDVAMLLVLASAVLSYTWVGFLGSDDATYARGGIGWLTEFPYVGGHGTIREPVVLPIALSFGLLGQSEFSLVLPSTLYFLSLVLMTYYAMSETAGRLPALIAGSLLILTPLLSVEATIANVDIAELFFCGLSFWLFYAATKSGRPARLMYPAGLALGLAFLCRETTASVLIFYSILFLVGFGVPRRFYWVMAGGFFTVVGIEVMYLTVMTGDPLYRYTISLHHGTVDRSADDRGNISVGPFSPLAMILINQEFGFLFWFALPAAVYLWRTQDLDHDTRTLVLLLSGFGASAFAFLAVNTALLPLNPRYAANATYAAVLIFTLGITYWIRRGRLKWAGGLIGFLVVTNLLCLYVENKKPLFGEYALISYLEGSGQRVHIDPNTYRRVRLLLKWHNLTDRVTVGPPLPGAFYFYNPARIVRAVGGITSNNIHLFQPKRDWREVWRAEDPPRILGELFARSGMEVLIPERILNKLWRPNPTVSVLRAPNVVKADDGSR